MSLPRAHLDIATEVAESELQETTLASGEAPDSAGQPDQDGSHKSGGKKSGIRHILSVLGPGVITGASDDDPSGIGTYSVAGAQFGYRRFWQAWQRIHCRQPYRRYAPASGW